MDAALTRGPMFQSPLPIFNSFPASLAKFRLSFPPDLLLSKLRPRMSTRSAISFRIIPAIACASLGAYLTVPSYLLLLLLPRNGLWYSWIGILSVIELVCSIRFLIGKGMFGD